MSNTIRPSGVAINTQMMRNQMGANMGGNVNNPMMNMNNGMMQSAADMVRGQLTACLSQSNASGSGGFNWGRGGAGLIYDDALKSLTAGTADTNNSANDDFYIEKAAAGMGVFMREMASRAGSFYEQYKVVRDNFRTVERFGQLQQDPVLNAFIDDVVKQADLTRILGFNAVPMFGYSLVQVAKSAGPDAKFAPQHYLEAVAVGCRNALYFELISWLMGSPKGREMIPMISKELKDAIGSLDKNKEMAAVAFEFFGQSLPWASLEFKVPKNTRPDYNMMFGPNNGYPDAALGADIAERYSQPDLSTMDPAIALVLRNAQIRKQAMATGQFKHPVINSSPYVGDIPVDYNIIRKDWENITPENRDEFRSRRLFHNVGKANLYFISEGDWKRVKPAYRKHSEQEGEESVVKGTFRIVRIDLDKDDGWVSTIVRAENLTMPQVLTDPTKLLPLIEEPKESDFLAVTAYSINEVATPGSLEVPLETINKLGKGIFVVTIDEPIVSESSKKLENTMSNANKTAMGSFTGESATTFNVINWDTYTCPSESDRSMLFVKAPYLFKDGDMSNDGLPHTFYQQVIHLGKLAEERLIDDSLMQFIEQHLSKEVNSWLANIGGFDVVGKNVVKVDNVFDDIRELSEYLKTNDRELYGALHDTDKPHMLKRAMAYFVYDHSSMAKDTDSNPDSLLSQAEEELDLHAQRQMFVAIINERHGPAVEPDGNAITLKRSKFPEYFDLIEKSFPGTMGLEMDVEEADKILLFRDNGNMWLFNYSATDRNVATLRQVSRRAQLVSLEFTK